tara:strand:- start:217 stop:990 length:774 start_codon:yes stop_codon:yes gene_type:complete
MTKKLILILSAVFFSFLSLTAFAAGTKIEYPEQNWSFSGLFGIFDKASAQRGYQVYREVCSGCHGMRLINYRNLSALGYNTEELKALAAEFEVQDGPNDEGEFFTRPGRPSDKFISPYPNKQAARAANGGAYPPDLSLIIKARANGANYLHALLSGYTEPPKDMKVPDGMYYNSFYSGNLIAMPQPLYDDGITYFDGTKATKDQMATDVTTFLAWASEPELEKRKRLGVTVISFLLVFSMLAYFSMKQIWAPIKKKI